MEKEIRLLTPTEKYEQSSLSKSREGQSLLEFSLVLPLLLLIVVATVEGIKCPIFNERNATVRP